MKKKEKGHETVSKTLHGLKIYSVLCLLANAHCVQRIQDLFVHPDGTARGLYGELIDPGLIGPATTVRASHVEPHPDGGWTADLLPSGGPVLGPFPLRSTALAAERDWLTENLLPSK